ncbi:hypothetical protein AA0243_2165 [Novacetimonas hansenii NRIC 0243]|nr:hypothetical protein AA0243_2165 [Novacetimonas hansenii NRIC 0243]
MTCRVTATSDPWLRTRVALTVRLSGVLLASWCCAVAACAVRGVPLTAPLAATRCVVAVVVVVVVSAAEAEAHVPTDENRV